MKKLSFLMATCILSGGLGVKPAVAGLFSSKKNQSEDVASEKSAPTDKAVLQKVFDEARTSLLELEGIVAAGNYSLALEKAKASLDSVRTKSGIHPKAAYRQKIFLEPGSLGNYLLKGVTSLEGLPIDIQDQIVLTVANFKGGYFLDILNLMKRTNLIYIRAMHEVLKQNGKLLDRDKEKIKQDINDAFAVPLYLKDSSAEGYLLVFDKDVANSDQNYLFNRELIMYILKNGEELGIPSEQKLNEMLFSREVELRKELLSAPQLKSGILQSPEQIKASENYQKCISLANGYDKVSVRDQDYCLSTAAYFNFLSPSFTACLDRKWAFLSYNHERSEAVRSCVYIKK